MRCIINGIDLMPLETYALDCEAVLDPSGVDYLYTKVSGVMRCVVNGLVSVANGPPMSYSFGAPIAAPTGRLRAAPVYVAAAVPATVPSIDTPPAVGLAFGGPFPVRTVTITPNPAPLTHAAIRHRLAVPRGKIWIFSGPGMEAGAPAAGTPGAPVGNAGVPAIVMLESPVGASLCDCKNGPFSKVIGIHTSLGDSATFLVDVAFETYINESVQNGVNLGIGGLPLLSHRFAMTHNIPQDGYTSITVDGLAIFRTDFIYGQPWNPDTARPFLFMPIPQGFVRDIEFVRGREDVTGVEYRYTDTQVPVNFPAGPYAQAATISVRHRQAVKSNIDILGSALSAYERAR